MPLFAFNLTTSPLTLSAGNPAPTLEASTVVGQRGPVYNVTSELRPNLTVDPAHGKSGGLTGANYVTLQAQVTAGSVAFEWSGDPEYLTTGLTVSGPAAAPHAASHVTGTDQLADASATGPVHGLMPGADKVKVDSITVANIPAAGEKAALAGTSGTPGSGNKYVTDADPRVTRIGAPELDRLDVDNGAPIAAAGGDLILIGRDLLQGQTFDGIQKTEGSAFFYAYALKPGVSGITVQIVVGAGILSVAFNPSTGALVITLPAIGDTDDNIAAAINADLSPANGYVRAVSGSGGSFTLASPTEAMIGGTGTYAKNKVMVAGLEALPANETGVNAGQKWNGTDITCTSQAVGAATDVAAIAVESNGLWTQQICGVMV